ncbi:glycosyltransferase [Jatrophihabitans telluris]|uniref:Glycosyltransferase n=1 Tax=Jatrophihabitans telluris TaxID=2038343 RepID=A0ABY4QW90_9ACTN|nr:glycosyltransferase [Jatrophihabitans telluris]UQX87554.1 glycosyltransferase [Jatrophihabitans telluris]
MTDQSALTNGVVSIVVLNFRGAEDTLTCLRELTELDYPSELLDIICVDNDSGDGSFERLSQEAPSGVRVFASGSNGGFTAGCNFGASLARGEFLAFINNDARPDRAWLVEAVRALADDSTVGCVASKVLDWDGVDVDFTDAALAWYGMGYKPGAGSPYTGDAEQPKDVLFATGSAMVTRTALFAEVGGFDERYFMFYEDVDYGWRLNILGHRVRYVPTSVVFHKHHASMKAFGAYREWYLLERNALMSLYKNVQDETLLKLLAPALMLSVRRGLALGGVDTGSLDLRRSTGDDSAETIEVSRRGLTGAFAIDYFLDQLPSLEKSRAELQAKRVRTDREIMPLMRKAIEPAIPNERYLAGHQALVDAFGITEVFSGRSRVLVVTGDPLSVKMAGPGIRALHIAEALADEHDVRLVSTTSCSLDETRFEVLERPIAKLKADVEWAEIVVFQGFLLNQIPWLADTEKILVVDLYDPMHLEQLEQTRGDEPHKRTADVASTTKVLNDQLRRGDFFLCASDKQRHFWLGQLAAVGRLNPRTYDRDSTLTSLVAVVPFGLPDERAVQERSPIKGGSVPGISAEDKVILWAGGIYNWFDPLTLLRAVDKLSARHPDVRLFFLGTQHPNALVPKMRMVERTRALADSLGLTGKVVFFNEGWVDYSDRKNYLLDADLGVSTHFEHIETTFSFRTRILDYLWAGLPVVVTDGDNFGDLVRVEKLGVAVPEQDVDALAEALERCLYDEAFIAESRAAVARVAPQFQWSAALAPLIEFCRAPERAPDAEILSSARRKARKSGATVGGRGDLALARKYLSEGGVEELTRRAAGRIRRKLGLR